MSIIERIKNLLSKKKKITPPSHDTSEITPMDPTPVTPLKPEPVTPIDPPVKPVEEVEDVVDDPLPLLDENGNTIVENYKNPEDCGDSDFAEEI